MKKISILMAAAALVVLTSCGSKKPVVQTASYFNQTTECLGEEQSVGGGIEETQGIVVARTGLSLQAPVGGPAEIGTNGQHYGSLRHHRLEEMGGGQLFLLLCRTRHHNAV